MQNPPWESKDDFDIDERPKKKRRVKERWYFEIVYPEGMGPEDFEDVDETEGEQTQDTSDLKVRETDDDETKLSGESFAASSTTPQSPMSLQTTAYNQNVLSNPADKISLDKAIYNSPHHLQAPTLSTLSESSESSQLPQSSAETSFDRQSTAAENSENLDTIVLIPSSCPEEHISSSPGSSRVISPTNNLELPTHNANLARPRLAPSRSSATASSTSSRPDIFSGSSPLSSLPSSPVLPSGSQLAPLFNQLEEARKQSLANSDPCASTDSTCTRERTLQRDDSRSKSSQSDDEPSAFESSQNSSRPLRSFKGRDLFDSIIWADAYSTSIFYMFITSFRKKVFNDVQSTSPTHKFIRTLRDGGRLVRNYTQNIDSLEEREGLATDLALGPGSRARFSAKTQRERRPSDLQGNSPHSTGVECVQLHGSLVSLRCGLCGKLSGWDEADRESITLSGQAPDCPSCTEYNARRTGRGRRGLAVGRLRPDIVLYGEEHPSAHLVAPLITHDLSLGPDVLLIMGTSLKVHGLKIMVKEFAKAVHNKGGKVIFVNRTKPPESTWGDVIDYWVECDCDAWVLDLKSRRGDLWLPQGVVEDTKSSKEQAKEKRKEPKPTAVNKKTVRPQSTRDDRMSGAYHTFKILDLLWKLRDDRGEIAPRPTYWQKRARASTGSIIETQAPASKRLSKNTQTKKNNTSVITNNRRMSYPSYIHDENRDAEKIAYIEKQWEQLRVKAPGLPEKVPESVVRSGRVALSDLSNLPLFLPSFKYSFNPGTYDITSSSHIPNLKGLSLPPQMSLLSHPPSGAKLPLHSPTSESSMRVSSHSYSTRNHRGSTKTTLATSSTNVVDKKLFVNNAVIALGDFSAEDTIVVAPPPLTPKAKRIKRMGSLGTILSSSPEIYHDAQDRLDDAASRTSQEFHDAIE